MGCCSCSNNINPTNPDHMFKEELYMQNIVEY